MKCIVSAVLALCLLSSCMTSAPPSTPPAPIAERDSAPRVAVPRAELETLADPAPRSEPRARYGNHSPYRVLGKTYRVMEDARGYRAEGVASWYGQKFHGQATSTLEPYDMFALTAAHRALPLPSYVRVTNLRNDKSTVVRVNDRGPFHDDRVIDLSYAAAVKLGFDLQGTAPVRVEMLAAPTRSASVPALDARAAATANSGSDQASARMFLQAGAFSQRGLAEQLTNTVRNTLGDQVRVSIEHGSDRLHRVRVGPIASDQDAERYRRDLARANLSTVLVRE